MSSKIPQGDNSSDEAVQLFRRVKYRMSQIKRLYNEIDTVEQMLEDEKVLRLRQSLSQECESLAQYSTFRREALEIFWIYCCYKPIAAFKHFFNEEQVFKQFLTEETNQKEENAIKSLKIFISSNISQISSFLTKFQDFKHSLLLWLGDLYRYSFIYCGEDKRDFTICEQCYVNAAFCDPKNWKPYSQLALLNSKIDPNLAFFLFLRSLAQHKKADKNSDGIQNNINLLANKEGTSNNSSANFEFDVTLKFVNIVAFEFSRLQFEESRKEMDKLFESFKTSNNFKTFLQHINCCTLAVSFALQNQPTDEHFRYITSFTCQKLIYVLEEARRLFAAKENDEEEDVQINKRRRKKKQRSSSSSSNSENEKEEKTQNNNLKNNQQNEEEDDITFLTTVWQSAIIVSEFISNCAEYFTIRKLSVSLKLQYQNILKTFVELLNDLITRISPLMEAEDNSNSSERRALVNWFMYKFDENKGYKLFVVVLVYYIRNIISARFAGIVFDKYFKLASSNICEKERKTMEGISRLHSAHVSKINETLSKIPVYIAPDHHVLLERLTLMDQLCQTAKQNTIITRSVLAKLDKLKKDSANAREAIRWIQGSVTDHKIKLFHEVESEKNLFSELKAFLEEKNLLDKQTLFLSILTSEGSEKDVKIVTDGELIRYPVIGIERIENFAKRMAETDIPKG
uniref:Uncharacterized protein n=1 Tax=Meloidogyne enterolobii TaxID=390850 RepID=A0A6V7TJQ0_MELEN|nr:unnamed protein product [Meloidogyne enterolobii]